MVPNLVNKFAALCGYWQFVTIFARDRYMSLSQAKWVQSAPSLPKCCTIHFNIILPSMPKYSHHIDVLNIASYTICSCCGYFCFISQNIAVIYVHETLRYLHRQNYTLDYVFGKTLLFYASKYNLVTQEKK
jgi:hypothetical protein